MKNLSYILVAVSLIIPAHSSAHHSFAVHFDGKNLVEVHGTVKEFRFTNPHGILLFTAEDENGNTVEWRAETNSPTMLMRRGWHGDSMEAGDKIIISGFPAKKIPYYMRISTVEIEGKGRLTAQAKAD